VNLPPFAEVAGALRKVTEHLACVASAGKQNRPPEWTQFEWRIARAVAAMQGVSSILNASPGSGGPETWRQFLHSQYLATKAKHERIELLLTSIDFQARRAGVPMVALKGAALYKAGVYAAGDRPMADIDLLVGAGDMRAISRILETCNYRLSLSGPRHQTYVDGNMPLFGAAMLGEQADAPIKIEVHEKISEFLPVAEVDISSHVFPLAAEPGINAYASLTGLMLHLLLHAAGNMRARALRQIQLHDIALLGRRLQPDDWDTVFSATAAGPRPGWAYPPLLLTAQYYPHVIPFRRLEELSRGCPHWLRKWTSRQRLSDVSWSNFRIEAFPGLEWCQSPIEVAKFVVSRVWPSRKARKDLRDAAADMPQGFSVPWYGISHGSRIVRWVISRPPRVQSLLSVRAALSHEE
jgi:hypothetical protein